MEREFVAVDFEVKVRVELWRGDGQVDDVALRVRVGPVSDSRPCVSVCLEGARRMDEVEPGEEARASRSGTGWTYERWAHKSSGCVTAMYLSTSESRTSLKC